MASLEANRRRHAPHDQDAQEARAEHDDSGRASILLNVERSDLYVAIGDIDGALDCLESARIQAYQNNERELYDHIMEKMDSMETQLSQK